MEFNGKKVAVVGLGVSNLPLIRFLQAKGAQVTGCDKKSREELGSRLPLLEATGCRLALGAGYLDSLQEHQLIFLTPGMRKNLPEIAQARAAGAQISSEIALVFELCRAPILGITGSSGKTTTTMLCGRILEAHGDQVWVGGNIGQPLIEQVEAIPPTGKVVLELSSFQLEELGRSPHLSIVTNITPNHLDQHASMAEYIEAKQHIYRYQAPGDACILNYDDPTTRAMAQDCPGRVAFFSRQAELAEGAFVRDDELLLRWNGREERLCARRELKLIGEHNVENVLAASLAAYLFGAQTSAIHAAVTTFTGAPHRLEFVREVGGVRYYNDSIATTPNRAMAALHSFASPIVLIAGGYDKKLPFDDFARLAVQKVRAMVVLGVTAGLIEAAVQQAAAEAGVRGPLLLKATSFDEAVMLAARQATPGDVVLLSPACASYDMFHNFEERGQRFRDLVRGL